MNTITLRPFFVAKLALFAAAGLMLLSSCDGFGIRGNGNIVTENRPIGDFTTLEAHGAFEIEWTPGAPALAITTDENLQRYVDAQITGHKLVLRSHNTLRPTRKLRVRVTSSGLTAVAVRGAVVFRASGLTGQNFYLEGSGATSTILRGNVGALAASMSGASKLDADELQTQTSELAITGAGKADVFASERLRVAISGAGKVVYAGNPKTVEKQVSGAGSVQQKD